MRDNFAIAMVTLDPKYLLEKLDVVWQTQMCN